MEYLVQLKLGQNPSAVRIVHHCDEPLACALVLLGCSLGLHVEVVSHCCWVEL